MLSFNKRINNHKSRLNYQHKILNPKKSYLTLNFIALLLILKISKFIVVTQNIQTVIIKIKGSGFQSILTPEPDKNHGLTCPDNIEINNKTYNNQNECDLIYLTSEISIVKMEWNNIIMIFNMFRGMINVTEIDISNFDTSLYTTFSMMFQDCFSLKSVNFGNMERSSIQSINSMFFNCKSLIFVDLSSFKSSKLTSMGNVFFNCISLKNVNLTGLDTSRVIAMDNMFNNCTSLTSLDLSNFDTSSVTNIDYMFYNCKNLEYINLQKAVFGNLNSYNNILDNIKINFVICVNSRIITEHIDENCVTITCDTNWKELQKKLNPKTNKCSNSCGGKYEFENECLDICPQGYEPFNNKCIKQKPTTILTIFQEIKTTIPEKQTTQLTPITDLIQVSNNFYIDNITYNIENITSCDVINFLKKKIFSRTK